MNNMHIHNHSHRKGWFRSRTVWVLLGFLAIGAFFLFTEHRAHLLPYLPYLPYLLFLCCPLMMFFMMHGGHDNHDDHGPHDTYDEYQGYGSAGHREQPRSQEDSNE